MIASSTRVGVPAFLLCAAVLTGCSDSGDSGDSGAPSPASSTSAPSSVPATSGTPAGTVTATPTTGTTPTGPSQPTTVSGSPIAARVGLAMAELGPEDPSPGGQYVVLRNDTANAVDVHCWTIWSVATGSAARVSGVHDLAAGASARLFTDRGLLNNVDTLRLVDQDGKEIERTPQLRDRTGDDRIWFRDRAGGWRFTRGLPVPSHIVDGRLVRATGAC